MTIPNYQEMQDHYDRCGDSECPVETLFDELLYPLIMDFDRYGRRGRHPPIHLKRTPGGVSHAEYVNGWETYCGIKRYHGKASAKRSGSIYEKWICRKCREAFGREGT